MAVLAPAAETLPTIRSLNRNELMKLLVDQFGGMSGVATGGSTSYLDDTTLLKSTQYSDDQWVSAWMRISKDASSVGSANENVPVAITTYDPTTNGRISISPSLGIAVASSDEYEIWKNPHPKVVTNIIDRALTNDVPLPCWSLLSEIPDFDMEQSNTTDWTGVNATVAKSTTVPLMNGIRYLTSTNTSANGYTRSQYINVEPGISCYVSAMFRCGSASDTAKLVVYDETNSAQIASKTAIRLQKSRMHFNFQVPATCYKISIRLGHDTNGTASAWDDIILFSHSATSISLPWWVQSKDQVKAIFRLNSRDLASGVIDTELQGELDPKWDVIDDSFGTGKLKLQGRSGNISGPLYIFGVRYETAYSNDNTDYKMIDPNFMLACVAYKVYEYLNQENREGYLDKKFVAEKYDQWKKKYSDMMYQFNQRIENVLRSVPTRAYVNHATDSLGW